MLNLSIRDFYDSITISDLSSKIIQLQRRFTNRNIINESIDVEKIILKENNEEYIEKNIEIYNLPEIVINNFEETFKENIYSFPKKIIHFFCIIYILIIFTIPIVAGIIFLILFQLLAFFFFKFYTYNCNENKNCNLKIIESFSISLILMGSGFIILTLLSKWLIIGKYKKMKCKLWSFYFFRWWTVHRIILNINIFLSIFQRTSIISWWYKLMGTFFFF